MHIGPYFLPSRLALAPMAGVSDRPFREVCRSFGAGLTVSEMVAADPRLYASAKTSRRLAHEGEPGPVVVQLVGAEARPLAEAARFHLARGAQIIDLNLGCPARKVCRKAAGSALLREPRRVAEILHAVVRAAGTAPVTLKMRTGWSPAERNGVEIARLAEDLGIQALAVHGRTRVCRFAGEAEYDTIAAIKAAVSVPVWANGDIDSPQKAQRVLAHTGADGLMIGRAARGRPWLFRRIDHYLRTGALLPEPRPRQRVGILRRHLERLYAFYGEQRGVRIARKHIDWYTRGLEGAEAFRAHANRPETIAGQLAAVEAFFATLETAACS